MAKIEVYHAKESDWVVAKPAPGQEKSQGASRPRHAGSPDQPQMLEVKVFPGEQVPVHAHETGEFFYIVRGEMHFGQHVLKPGDSIYIPGMMLYSFKGGPEGVEFVNCRPRQDLSHFWLDDVKAMEKLGPQEKAAFIAANIEKAKSYYNLD